MNNQPLGFSKENRKKNVAYKIAIWVFTALAILALWFVYNNSITVPIAWCLFANAIWIVILFALKIRSNK